MKRNSVICAFSALMLLVLLCGCETLEGDKSKKEPAYVITINAFAKQPTKSKELEKEVTSFGGGKTVWINTNAFLHSRNIQDIEIIPSAEKKGYYDLELKLDYHGKNVWMQLSVNSLYTELAFLVDGVYYRPIKPDRISTEDEYVVYLRGPFDSVTAKSIKENAASNYKYFNGEPRER